MRFTAASVAALTVIQHASASVVVQESSTGLPMRKRRKHHRFLKQMGRQGSKVTKKGDEPLPFGFEYDQQKLQKKQNDDTIIPPLWDAEHSAIERENRRSNQEQRSDEDPDVGILSFQQHQQQHSKNYGNNNITLQPLWSQKSSVSDSSVNKGNESYFVNECDPDVGILSCTDGFYCQQGRCVLSSSKIRRELQAVCPNGIQGFQCNCDELVNGVGPFVCYNTNFCLDDGITCAYLARFYTVDAAGNYQNINTFGDISSGQYFSYGYLVNEGQLVGCIAASGDCSCDCYVGSCKGYADITRVVCNGADAVIEEDFCQTGNDIISFLRDADFNFTCDDTSGYVGDTQYRCPPIYASYSLNVYDCNCDDFDNTSGLGYFTCTVNNYCLYEDPTICGVKNFSNDVLGPSTRTYSVSFEYGTDSYAYTFLPDGGCAVEVDGCECTCEQGSCFGDFPTDNTVRILCPGIGPIDACGAPAGFLLDVNPICTNTSPPRATEAPVSTPTAAAVIVTTNSPTKSPLSASPVTKAPTTNAPTTKAPTAKASTSKAPTSKAPTTKAPTTKAPTTKAPSTNPPATKAPTTKSPTTKATISDPPTTEALLSDPSTTEVPISDPLTTIYPTTEVPTTLPPITLFPTTAVPITKTPSVGVTMTETRMEGGPTTENPLTAAPTESPVAIPTTEAPVTSTPVGNNNVRSDGNDDSAAGDRLHHIWIPALVVIEMCIRLIRS